MLLWKTVCRSGVVVGSIETVMAWWCVGTGEVEGLVWRCGKMGTFLNSCQLYIKGKPFRKSVVLVDPETILYTRLKLLLLQRPNPAQEDHLTTHGLIDCLCIIFICTFYLYLRMWLKIQVDRTHTVGLRLYNFILSL